MQKLKKDSSSPSKVNKSSWDVVGVCLEEVFVVWRRLRTGRDDEDLDLWVYAWPDLRRMWCFGLGGGDIAPTARRGDIVCYMCCYIKLESSMRARFDVLSEDERERAEGDGGVYTRVYSDSKQLSGCMHERTAKNPSFAARCTVMQGSRIDPVAICRVL